MKNNEILLSVRFEVNDKQRVLTFLALKDISLKAFVQGVYYGLKNLDVQSDKKTGESENAVQGTLSIGECAHAFEKYIKTHRELLVLYTIMGEYARIDIAAESTDIFDERKRKKRNCDMPLSSLGIVTSSQILITEKPVMSHIPQLFDRADKEKTYILRDNNTLEYNISTRRLNVIEPTVIDILPAGEMPAKSKGSLLDTIAPPLITGLGMVGLRFLVSKFSGSSSFNDSMLAMTIAMPFMSAVNSVYGRFRQSKEHRQSVSEWKEKYEKYINETIIKKKIVQWQKDEIVYLNKVYPEMGTLFNQTGEISTAIFARSQNDNDFMRISLGNSDEIKPSFEIKSETKDEIFYDVRYKLHPPVKGEHDTPYITIEIPDEKKRKKSYQETAHELKNQFLLTELPYIFATTQESEGENGKKELTGFKFLRDSSPKAEKPPLLIDLRNMGTLGVISKNDEVSLKFIRHLAFELSFYHSPEDLQMVFFFPAEKSIQKQDAILCDYMFLPHVNELFDNLSQFVFDEDSAGEVFSKLQSIIAERDKSHSGDNSEENAVTEKHTQIVCFVMDDYDIKEKAFSKYIPEAPKEGDDYVNSLGLTFIFIQKEKGLLPKYCGSIVELDDTLHRVSNRYNLLSHETLSKLAKGTDSSATTDDIIEYTDFNNDYIFGNGSALHPNSEFSLAFKRLSSIYYTRVAENGKVPSMVTLFELFDDIYSVSNNEIQRDGLTKIISENWRDIKKNDVTKDLRVALGKNEHGITYLDLHENADGPHMLVAGTTGSGKSETIITYLIGLCVKYAPADLNLMLVDMKGGGFSERLGKLPHCVGTVTNTAGESQGISAVYMLKRFLESLNAEVKNRQIILADLDVDNADAYIRVLRKIKRIHALRYSPDKKAERDELVNEIREGKKEKQIRYIDGDISKLKSLSHLILVVDEFTELKRFSNESDDIDFISEITTIARIGRTLGLHIILVSQNIEGAINDDIRVNTKSKICLKVATKQASKEMLGTTDAAAATMPGHGRAYILVGTGSRYEYFQSAYTGANKNTDIKPPTQMTYVTNTGKYNSEFYNSSKHNTLMMARNKKLSTGVTQLEYVAEQIVQLAGQRTKSGKPIFEIPEQIFRDPLPLMLSDSGDVFNQWNEV